MKWLREIAALVLFIVGCTATDLGERTGLPAYYAIGMPMISLAAVIFGMIMDRIFWSQKTVESRLEVFIIRVGVLAIGAFSGLVVAYIWYNQNKTVFLWGFLLFIASGFTILAAIRQGVYLARELRWRHH